MGTIFDLHEETLQVYQEFARSFIRIADRRIRKEVEKLLEEGESFWPAPLLQISPSYKRASSVDDLAKEGILLQETAQIFRTARGHPYRLYQHQEEALRKARAQKSYILTSGTGSGKSLAYFLPIIDNILRKPPSGHHTLALIVYPMNALVNSQYNSLLVLQKHYEERTGREFPVTFTRYTGETPEEEREKWRQRPPQILLTNYVMGELLLVRPEDAAFLPSTERAQVEGLRFLVFDELHVYRGRQGADVAMLVRRLKERAAGENLIHIGTSATMVSHPTATPRERRETVARFAAEFFGHPFTEEDIIEETLEPLTEGGEPSLEELREALKRGEPLPLEGEAFRRHPLIRWIEYRLGIERQEEGRFRRRIPVALSEAAAMLAQEADLSPESARNLLKKALVQGASLVVPDGRPALAFKLHQFISQGRAIQATLESPETRLLSQAGMFQTEEGKILAPIKFCRFCGQEYYHLLKKDHRLFPYPSVEVAEEEGVQEVYLCIPSSEWDWSEEMLPDDWQDEEGRLKDPWKKRVPQKIWVAPDGQYAETPREGYIQAWCQEGNFYLCLRCGQYYDERTRDFAKLSTLSTEARTNATTILATALLQKAAATEAAQPKLLTFTDNRQDASLQAGHFNDFVQVVALRAALYQALLRSPDGKLHSNEVAEAVLKALQAAGITLQHIAKNPHVRPEYSNVQKIWNTFQRLLEYRLYEDLRRGWRIVQPNLEEVGLLRIEFEGLEDICHKSELWREEGLLYKLGPEERIRLVRPILNHFRRKLAIDSVIFQEEEQRRLRRSALELLDPFWGIEEELEELRPARRFTLDPLSGKKSAPHAISLGPQSLIGRFLRKELSLDRESYLKVIQFLLEVLLGANLLVKQSEHGRAFYRLKGYHLVWCLGDGTAPPVDSLYSRGSAQRPGVNEYFKELYQQSPADLVTLEAREHTAQVVAPGERERREARFRWNPDDQARAAELGRRLPYLICSPTMELGVDIADLELVHLRNVPPTPANYAQRSGRAGRQGQPGLIFTYCGAYNPHDQYFFHHRQEMVAGTVKPPLIDLTSDALLKPHIHALWLSEIRLPLKNSIDHIIRIDHPDLPLREDIQRQLEMTQTPAWQRQLRSRIQKVLESIVDAEGNPLSWSDEWLQSILEGAATTFDRAFDRWRELYWAAIRQRDEARSEFDRAVTKEEQKRAEAKENEAKRQINLLRQIGVEREESDFYPYRYLASEGFLPGYNFPALPVRAWVPRGDGEFLARPRALAIREYAPFNIVYHEGAKWQVVAFQTPPGGLESRITTNKRLCLTCQTFCEVHLERCPTCNTPFNADNSRVPTLLEMPNVRLRRRERITSEEEERRRQGYEIQLFYQLRGSRLIEADLHGPWAVDESTRPALLYAPAAPLLFVNYGFKGKPDEGFSVNLEDGSLRTASIEEPLSTSTRRVHLYVQTTHNVLRLQLPKIAFGERAPSEVLISLQYALLRGMETVFQLEEGEILVQLVGEGPHMALLFYEASEGGIGALRRVVTEPHRLAQIARAALSICHFDPTGQDTKPTCSAACYECLLSFANQADAPYINRHHIRDTLLGLCQVEVLRRTSQRPYQEQLDYLLSRTDPQSDLERQFLHALAQKRYRLPDDAQKPIRVENQKIIADFFYEPNICVFCDGSVHDDPNIRAQDHQQRRLLRHKGYRVVAIRYDRDLLSQIAEHVDIFGPSEMDAAPALEHLVFPSPKDNPLMQKSPESEW